MKQFVNLWSKDQYIVVGDGDTILELLERMSDEQLLTMSDLIAQVKNERRGYSMTSRCPRCGSRECGCKKG